MKRTKARPVKAWIIALLGKLLCLFGKHRRGKRIADDPLGQHSAQTGRIVYRCPRCGATHTRKMKKAEV